MSNNNEERLVSAYELETEANTDRLAEVSSFVEACLDEAGCGIKTRMQISVAVEESHGKGGSGREPFCRG